MLQIRHLTIVHNKDFRTLLEDFSFMLNEGDKAVIIGEEGNGKSTLLKLIADPALVDPYVEYSGDIVKGNTRFGYLAQEMPVEDRLKTVYEYFSEEDAFFTLLPQEIQKILTQLNLDEAFCYLEQRIETLSGGEKIKMQMARILMQKPDTLLLDEPSNDIDLETLEWLEKFINSCDIPVLFVSHDETLIERTANVVIHLELVRHKMLPRWTVARIPYKEYIEQRFASLTHQEQVARKEKAEFDIKQEKLRRIQEKVEHQQENITRADPHGGRMLKKKMKAVKSMEKRFEKEEEKLTQIPDMEDSISLFFSDDVTLPNGKNVLEFSLDKLMIGEKVLSQDIHLRVTGGEKICIIGKNGVGKTTLIKHIAQALVPRKDISAAYMPQDYEQLLRMDETPVEFLTRVGAKQEITKIRTFLGNLRYTPDEMTHTIREMSGGQKAKLLFVKMILDGNNVLILDEPTRNFSPLSNPVIREALKRYQGAVISVSHDRKYISEVCTKVYELTPKGLQLK